MFVVAFQVSFLNLIPEFAAYQPLIPSRWRGSIYKLVWLDLLVFLTVYYILNITYRVGLDEHQKQ